jgi:hypothetical protein
VSYNRYGFRLTAGSLCRHLAADILALIPTGTVLIGYARCSTDKQDLAAQRAALEALGVAADRIYTDHGLSGTTRARPGLDQALAAVRSGDMLVVPKLTGSPARSPTPAPSPTRWLRAASGSSLAQASTIPMI